VSELPGPGQGSGWSGGAQGAQNPASSGFGPYPRGYPGGVPPTKPPTGLPARPRKSRVGLVIGLVGGFCVLVLVGGAIGGHVVWQHHVASQRHAQERAILAIYHEMGRPSGFTEQRGSPRLRGTTWVTATWTAPAGQDDPISATAIWLDEHIKSVQPSDDDVRRGFGSKGSPYFIEDPKAQNIQVMLSGTTSTDRIDVSMFL
jgi:hypothetical protein